MRKILLTSVFIGLLCLLIGIGEVFAQGGLEEAPLIKILGPGGVFEKLANVLFSLLVAASVILFIYAGFLFISSLGDPQKYDTAKKAVLYGIIGLIIALSSRGIVMLIKKALIPS